MSAATDAAGPPRPERGPWDAVRATPELAPGAVRRTSSIDMTRPGGFEGPVIAEVRGRDVARDGDGRDHIVDEVRLTAEIEEWSGRLVTIEGHDHHPGVDALVGTSIRRGYGRALTAALADELAERTLPASILEDLNGALLVSGYAPLRAGLLGMSPADGAERAEAQQDICAGWARGAPLVEGLRATGTNAVPFGPVAPALTASRGWHETLPAEAETVTRIRSLDVGPADGRGGTDVRAHFRDAYQGEDGPMIMHEYVVVAHVSGAAPTLDAVAVEPHVLPWRECPAAVASAAQLVGTPVADIPGRVRAELVGTSTCTHLNSTLRSLADVAHLLRLDVPPNGTRG